MIHTQQGDDYIASGILSETLLHEGCHTSIDPDYTYDATWQQAQDDDGNFISTYGRDNPDREDLAESILMWFAYRHRQDVLTADEISNIETYMPNRLLFFDTLELNLWPLEGENIGAIRNLSFMAL